MSTAVFQKAGLKLFAQHMKQYEPTDPVYEEYIDKKGRKRQRKVSSLSQVVCHDPKLTGFLKLALWRCLALSELARESFLQDCPHATRRSSKK